MKNVRHRVIKVIESIQPKNLFVNVIRLKIKTYIDKCIQKLNYVFHTFFLNIGVQPLVFDNTKLQHDDLKVSTFLYFNYLSVNNVHNTIVHVHMCICTYENFKNRFKNNVICTLF